METTNKEDAEGETTGGSLLKQTLMTVDECFVYKIPPMATSGGHRAEQWDLAKPIQTCGFQVERRDNDLYLLFTTENHTKLFALAHIATPCKEKTVNQSVQSVVDSSRYFVTHIANGQKTATIGFGFRDRDVAIDLLGTLQGFQKSIEREQLAKEQFASVAEVPKLGKDEKIHISIPGGGSSKRVKNKEKKVKASLTSMSGGTFVLKKPPKFEEGGGGDDDSDKRHTKQSAEEVQKVELSLGNLNIEEDHKRNTPNNEDSDSEGAVGGKSLVESLDNDLDFTDNTNGDDDDDFGDFQDAS